ncbi:MAG: ABC transporter ATP-binding protein [Caldilineaceae bacterium]
MVKAFARQGSRKASSRRVNWEKYVRGKRLLIAHALLAHHRHHVRPADDCGLRSGLLIMAINGTITLGQYLAYSGMVIWIIWPIRNLGRLIPCRCPKRWSPFSRVSEIIRQDREQLNVPGFVAPTKLRGEITYDNVSFAYRGSDAPVCATSASTRLPGNASRCWGPPARARRRWSTCCLYEYTDGRILLDGKELTTYSAGYLRQRIGIVRAGPFLFSRTIRDSITFGVGRQVSQEEIEAATRKPVHDVIMRPISPKGTSTLVGERGVTLSGGQKQRVAIARTLLKDRAS